RIMMEYPNITMEEYIKLQAEKAKRHFEANFPAIVYNDVLTSNENVSPEPTVSIYNAIETNFDFSISFSDSDDEDYTFICDKDLFSYKLIPVNNLKPELVNDHIEINTELCLETIDVKPIDSVACISNDNTPVESDDYLETNHDKKRAAPSYTFIQDHVRRLSHRLISYTIFSRGQAPEKVTGIDLFYLRSMDQGTANVPYLLALYLFKHTKRRKSIARMFEGYFIGRLAEHFGLVSDEGLMGLSVIVRMIPVIDLDELVAEGAPDIDEGAQAIPALVQVPQLPPAAIQTRTMPQSIARLEEEVHGIQESLAEQQEVMETMARDFFQRRMVRRRTSEANTSAVSLNEDQPDP
ncbi:hypothetical protein Tco_0815899, partial [Tanacetum coccineum]